MSDQEMSLPINLMGKNFSIKCPASQVQQLEQSVAFLQRRLTAMRQSNNESNLEKLLFIASLNLVHEVIHGDDNAAAHASNQRCQQLIDKIENHLSKTV